MTEERSPDEARTQAAMRAAMLDAVEIRHLEDLPESRGPEGRTHLARISLERAVLELVGEASLATVTVDALVEHSGTNRIRFYEIFATKEGCFEDAYEDAAEALAERLLRACATSADWAGGLRAALVDFASLLRREPALTRGLLASPAASTAGPARKREEVFGRLSRAIDRARRETDEPRHPPPPFTSRFILSAVEAAALKSLSVSGAHRFEDDLPGLLYMAVDFYLGPDAAQAQERALRAD